MMRCEDFQEALPDRLAQAARWTTEERAHLTDCARCQAEVAMVEDARGSGWSTAFHQDQVEERLLSELRAHTSRPSPTRTLHPWRWRASVALALAASLALVIWSPDRPSRTGGIEEPAGAAPLFPELMRLSPDELRSVLGSWQADDPEHYPASTPTLDDLDTAQLQRVLRQIEEGT